MNRRITPAGTVAGSAPTRRVLCAVACAGALYCGGPPPAPQPISLPDGSPTPNTYFVAQTSDTRFYTADHFVASIEMQISGEPFAQLLGRNLAGYNRYSLVTDLYKNPTSGTVTTNPLGYSMGVESYEYSKQPMNNTSFESGAGLSLQFGPVLNPKQVTGDDAYYLLLHRLQVFAAESLSGGPQGANWVVSPAPNDNPLNYYGWPGYWPVFAEFQSFKPDIAPAGGATHQCSLVFGYAALGTKTYVGDYECGYNSLNLPNRDSQVTKVLDPAALGFATWKQGLWVINYWQSMHDTLGNPIVQVADSDIPQIGQPYNMVTGQYPDPNDPTGNTLINGTNGVFLGDSAIEGWQGLTLIEEMDNKAALLLRKLLSTDGTSLGGFATTRDAMAYDYSSPLQYWPTEIAVTETGAPPPAGQSWQYFPQPSKFTIQTRASRLRGLAALTGGAAELFALTDFNNANVGALPSSRATFDGDPFAADNQLPDGEESPHDRALATIRLAVIDMDRLHFDPASSVLVDEATPSGASVNRGKTVTTIDSAYTIVALRTALRSLSSNLSLYSNDTPDAVGGPTAIDATPLHGANTPLPDRILQLIVAQADFIAGKLVAKDGSVANSYDLGSHQPDPSATKLESEASAVRGLLDAYLATSDTRYEQTAMRVFADLDRRFWMTDVRAYRTTAGVSDTLTFTPIAFGTLQGALRQYWKLVGNRPGNERLAAELLERVQRMNKLVANGWDDANADNKVQYPEECTGAGLQMAERALTGELSLPADHGDRDHDCVKEIAAAQLPAALAGQIILKRR